MLLTAAERQAYMQSTGIIHLLLWVAVLYVNVHRHLRSVIPEQGYQCTKRSVGFPCVTFPSLGICYAML